MAKWLITGAGSGLGLALTKVVLAAGGQVAGLVRRPESAAEVEALAPGRARSFIADMRDAAAVRAAVEAAETALGGLDVLVNNAGYGLIGAVEEASLEEMREQFEVNVFAPVIAIQAILPHFRRRRSGHIVNVTSVSGLAAWAGTGVYCGSKHALEGIGRTLAQELAPLGIKVTNVEPGGMRTDYAGRSMRVTERRIDDYEATAHASERILAQHAGSEAGDPLRIAAAILQIVDAPDPPVQLLLGADAVRYATQSMAAFQEEFGRWAALSLSTGFPES
ncbi:MAG: SDR family NAD(P)-dependent oxidoreductase [Alphaproteobacteria bacterium]|nr:SDR family NAD(P)-dependent oxidoreductase [Alphaproteobacteria bacterium]